MLKIWKIQSRTWVDEHNVKYKRTSETQIDTSDGRTLRAPRAGESIYLDGRGNGYLFA